MSKQEYTHIFGEMDLYLDQSYDKILKHAFSISEDCGYFVEGTANKKKLFLYSQDYDKAILIFEKGRVIELKRSEDEGKTWETLNFKDNLFEVNQETLKKYEKDIEWYKLEKDLKLPMSPGILIQELIKRYKMPAVKV